MNEHKFLTNIKKVALQYEVVGETVAEAKKIRITASEELFNGPCEID